METKEYIRRQKLDKSIKKTVISVLVPVCNVEPYLRQCLDSIINQTFKNIEIICVDDGSTDQSGMILDQYSIYDSRIRVFHKRNTGYGNSMNIALDHARGSYIAILESDDFAEENMLEKLYEAAILQEADVVKGNHYDYRDENNIFVDRLRDYHKNVIQNNISCPELLNLPDTIWSCLYKRSFLTEHNIRFHETPGASYQDISFALQVWLQAKRVCFIEDALLHYRRDNPSSSMNNPSKLFCVFDEYQWAAEKTEHILNADATLRRYFTASKYRDYLNHYHRVGVQYQYALLIRLEQEFHTDREQGRIVEETFLPAVWSQLQEIDSDRDVFFKKSARPVPDTRLLTCGFKNDEIYTAALWESLKKYPEVFIYGAGQVGKRLAEMLQKQEIPVKAFLVTEKADAVSTCMGIPVMEVQEEASFAETCAVVIAVTEWSQYELYRVLEKYDFQHVFRTDEILRRIMG